MARPKAKTENIIAVAAALLVWQAAAMTLHQPLLLASPWQVAVRLTTIWREAGFFASILTSFSLIALGFLLGVIAGILLAIPAARFPWVRALLKPYVVAIKSVPVASFVILALLWLSSRRLSTFIAFLMVFPVIYANVLEGILATDKQLLQMAKLYRVPFGRQLVMIYLPQLKPFLLAATSAALGMAWKAGVAAEVIGLPSGTMGEKLYDAKVYLNTVDLFTWTVLIVLLSVVFEKIFLFGLSRLFSDRGRFSVFFGTPRKQSDISPVFSPADIRLSHVSKAFEGKEVLKDITLTLPFGQRVCLMGKSGRGKTTLLNILMGFVHPDSGTLQGIPPRVAAVFQEDRLCEDFSAIDNIRFVTGSHVPEGTILRHLQALGLSEADIRQPVRTLSGGMRRRVALARAVLYDGQLLILDEAFKGLDGATRAQAIAYANQHTQGKTLLAVTHEAEEARLLGGQVVDLGEMA